MPTERAMINPALLSWARESAGLRIDEAAKKVQVKPGRIELWESGDAQPTIKQLRKLGATYKRPIAVFYLDEVPRDFTPLRDFRRLPGEVAGVQSPELRYEIRRALSRRDTALELMGPESEVPRLRLRCSLDDDADSVATRVRRRLGINLEDQLGWTPGNESLNKWRDAVENAGALVLQMQNVDRAESRGFSVAKPILPLIVLNIADRSPAARTFTLLHELGHILLRSGGLCDLDDHSTRPPEELRAEVFCNRLAGAILMPRDAILDLPMVAEATRDTTWDDVAIRRAANKFGASREAFLRRLLVLDKTNVRFYQRKREQYRREFIDWLDKEKAKKKKRPGGPRPSRVAVATAGRQFTRLVLGSYRQDKITVSDVSDLLEVKLKHIPEIQDAVFGRRAGSTE